eukprot:TRINITY_DN1300_c0_g2_i1.p3 TRINITY_DN1300_c0_g2~~TRINITY_DN1300_c0_g2_i1.p3  ORF type:complete len:140 (+),score=63.31 TRINITY_DN1300_c0_g2_i1:73-492(+)
MCIRDRSTQSTWEHTKMVDRNEGDGVDIFAQCREYLKEYNELVKYLPSEMKEISADERKGQKRKMPRVSLVQMEENVVKQREVLAKKKKTEDPEEERLKLRKNKPRRKRKKKVAKTETQEKAESKDGAEPMEDKSSDEE